jgi:hypothetical protein
MPKRHRFTQQGRKYPEHQVITMKDAATSRAFFDATDTHALLEPRLYVAGVIQHPTTKLYQVWLSTNGLDVTCLSAHYDEQRAEDDMQAVKALISSGDLYNDEKTAALFRRLAQESDEEPSPLPDELVRDITAEIARTAPLRSSHLQA